MKKNKTLEAAAFTGIITLFAAGFFIYFNILQQAVDFMMHLHVTSIK